MGRHDQNVDFSSAPILSQRLEVRGKGEVLIKTKVVKSNVWQFFTISVLLIQEWKETLSLAQGMLYLHLEVLNMLI